ncbi:branched-chain amino acid ABC transporter permease [Hydrogenophaga sp.]|uniref:branched-chain amino acid ABC transporter permease n=1 Tax=Hydrogenophaga sp. TaxID=1904254 RepID=UPI003F71E046
MNGLLLGGLYACIAAGFSLVWGVLNIINILHGAFIVLGAYVAFFAHQWWGIHPFVSAVAAGLITGAIGYFLQATLINRVVMKSVLITLTLTFGLELIANNAMLLAFTADFRKVVLQNPLGNADIGGIFLSLDRAAAMALSLVMIFAVVLTLKATRMGRAIVAVRTDREAAALMGVDVARTYALTFAIGAMMAGATGSLLSVVFPISPLSGHLFLGKAFVVCVLGGVGSIGGAVAGGMALGLIESFGGVLLGPENALILAFTLLLAFLVVRPQGLMGNKALV